MLLPVSPYALLRASKPKPPESFTTQYDLYSLSQSAGVSSGDAGISDAALPDMPEKNTPLPPAPAKKTHYISDIHNRHTSAMRRSSQSPASL